MTDWKRCIPGALVALAWGAGTLDAQQATPDTAKVAAEVWAADVAFDADVARRGLDAWVGWMTEDVFKPDLHGATVQGRAKVRIADERLFANPEGRLRWRPTESGAFSDPRYGWTRGQWEWVNSAGQATARGTYLTIWRREAEGWRVVVDTGVDQK
jgi:ketosteroid isomerase-like protein